MRNKVYWFILILGFTAFSCGRSSTHRGRLLAKVGNANLYESDLNIDIHNNKDSAAIKEKLVKDWIKNQLIFNIAMKNLSSNEKNKDKQLADYYRSLINYDYLEKIIAHDSDTSINESTLEQYYRDNQKNFELKRNIIRFLYVKIPVETPPKMKIKGWIQHPGKENMDSLKQYVKKYASNFSLDTLRWYYFSERIK